MESQENRQAEKNREQWKTLSEGKWGWKPELRKIDRRPSQGLQRSPTDEIHVEFEKWSEITKKHYNNISYDTTENVDGFKIRMEICKNVCRPLL